MTGNDTDRTSRLRVRLMQSACIAPLALGVLAIGAAPDAPVTGVSAAVAETSGNQLPPPPASHEMGFAIWYFAPPVIQGKDACPEEPALKNREIFLSKLPAEDSERLQKPEKPERNAAALAGRCHRSPMAATCAANIRNSRTGRCSGPYRVNMHGASISTAMRAMARAMPRAARIRILNRPTVRRASTTNLIARL